MDYCYFTLMQNEQCGKCWNLEFDRQGDKTHKEISKHSHSFVPLDYCIKCREPKYDSQGFQTHTDELNDFFYPQNIKISHKFISGIEAKYQDKQKRHRHFFTCFGIVLTAIVVITGVSNLFFDF